MHFGTYDTFWRVKPVIRVLGVACVLAMACSDRTQMPVAPPVDDLLIDRSERGDFASVDIQGCRVILEYQRDEGFLDYDNGCPHPMAMKAALLDKLLGSLFGETGIPNDVRSFRIGWTRRLSDELSRRIAFRASQSAEWKALVEKRGEMGHGDHGMASAFLGRWIHQEDFFREFNQSLLEHGAVVISARVEKPSLGIAARTRSEGWLLDHGVSAAQLLPIDAFVTLILAERPDAPDALPTAGGLEASP